MATHDLQECNASDYQTALDTLRKQPHDTPVSFLQAPLYGQLQAKTGKDTVYWTMRSDNKLVGCGLAVVYTAPGGLRFLYAPYGPVCNSWDVSLVQAVRDFLEPIAKRLGCSFVRLDNDTLDSSQLTPPIPNRLARTASLQPRAEWLLDTTMSEDDIWTGFHKHARYNVRLAERAKADIRIYKPQDAPLDDFLALMRTTAERDGFGIFDRSYYEAYLATLSPEEGFVVLCTIDGKPAAAGLFVIYDKQAHYVFAGSSNEYRKIAPAYAVIWQAVQEAKKRGCAIFNFGGITDDIKSQDLGGVTSFKKRFGGYSVLHPNPVDFVYRPWRYALFKLYKLVR